MHDDTGTVVFPESVAGETKEAEVCQDVGPFSHAVQSRGLGNGRKGPSPNTSFAFSRTEDDVKNVFFCFVLFTLNDKNSLSFQARSWNH